MDAAEALAERYLVYFGFGPVRYEPDGNCPPDFVTADGTAVEVRRLNQHFDRDGESVALEHDSFPYLAGMRHVLASFGSSKGGQSWWVGFHFHRPAPLWKKVEPKVRAALTDIDRAGAVTDRKIAIIRRFSITVLPCSSAQGERFLLSGYSDNDAGGWFVHEIQRNIQICVDEKTRKIARFRSQYPRWWLILVDHIGYGGSDFEAELLRERARVRHDWDRVVLLSPLDHTRATVVECSAHGD